MAIRFELIAIGVDPVDFGDVVELSSKIKRFFDTLGVRPSNKIFTTSYDLESNPQGCFRILRVENDPEICFNIDDRFMRRFVVIDPSDLERLEAAIVMISQKCASNRFALKIVKINGLSNRYIDTENNPFTIELDLDLKEEVGS